MADPSERLVNLTVALLETRRPMTFEEIRQRTRYYDQDDPESARRMFERDKDALRSLGVPVETRTLDAFGAEVGYIVDRRSYELPDIDLEPDEVAALALALRVTGEDAARIALAKVSARAPDPADFEAELPAQIELGSADLDAVADAVVDRQTLRFPYRTADGVDATRTVDPYAVVHRRGAWYLVGRDHDRDDLRSFRLDRVRGRFRPVGEAGSFEPPEGLDPTTVVGTQDELDALVAIDPAVRWEAELRGGEDTGELHRGWPVFRLPHADRWRTVSWVLGLGPEAVVLAPDEFRREVRRRLSAVVEGAS